MAYSILCDEHIEKQVTHYLRREGHDVERVVAVPELGDGATDAAIRAYARDTDRLVLTSDSGFLRADTTPHPGVLFLVDDKLPAHRVATVVDRIAETIPQSEIERAVYVTTDWL